MPLIQGKQVDLATVTGLMSQSLQNELAVDASTASTVFVPFLSLPVVIASATSKVFVTFALSGSGTVLLANAQFRLLVDGVPIRSTSVAILIPGVAQSGSISRRLTGLIPGPHVVSIEWKTDPGNIAFVRPVTAPDSEEAALIIQEFI